MAPTVELVKVFEPLQNRILIQLDRQEEMTPGGLYIPESSKELSRFGNVLAVGEGKVMEDGSRRPIDVKVGDRVVVGKYTGDDILLDDTMYRVMYDDDVLGVLRAEDGDG